MLEKGITLEKKITGKAANENELIMQVSALNSIRNTCEPTIDEVSEIFDKVKKAATDLTTHIRENRTTELLAWSKNFLKKGLTRGYTRAIMETLQGGTPQDRRTASRDARTVRTVSTLRIVVAPADSIPRTGVGYNTPNVHAESRRGIGTCIACTTTSAGTVKTV